MTSTALALAGSLLGVAVGIALLPLAGLTALEELKLEAPNFDTELYKKYYDFSEGQAAVLSKAEREYIDEHPSFNVLYDASSPPFEWCDENTQAHGISIDIMERISQAVGVSFNYIPVGHF